MRSAPASKVKYRPFRHGDFDAMARIVGEVWHAPFSESERQLAGSYDLAVVLSRSTWSQIAVVRRQIVGFVLVRAGSLDLEAAARWQGVARDALDELQRQSPVNGARLAAYSEAEQRIDLQLLEKSGCDPQYEFTLFILRPEARGQGIGRSLFDQAEAELSAQGAREAFLYTDESCTWGFYEHRGLRRAAEYHPQPGEGEDLLPAYYLYVDELGS